MLTRIKRIKIADERKYLIEYCIDSNEWNFIINEDNDFPKYFNNCEIAEDYAQQFEQYHFLTGCVNNTGRYNTNLEEEIKMIEQVKL